MVCCGRAKWAGHRFARPPFHSTSPYALAGRWLDPLQPRIVTSPRSSRSPTTLTLFSLVASSPVIVIPNPTTDCIHALFPTFASSFEDINTRRPLLILAPSLDELTERHARRVLAHIIARGSHPTGPPARRFYEVFNAYPTRRRPSPDRARCSGKRSRRLSRPRQCRSTRPRRLGPSCATRLRPRRPPLYASRGALTRMPT